MVKNIGDSTTKLFYNESENNVETNSPKGKNIIQYFASNKFREIILSMSYQRLQISNDTREISRAPALSTCFLVQCKIQYNIMMASATAVLSAKENHMASFLPKDISWFAMNADKTMTIKSYFKNIKISTY